MLVYIIYIIAFSILVFVSFIAVKALNRGLEAKQDHKRNLNLNNNSRDKKKDIN